MSKAKQNKAKRTKWLGIWLFLVCAMCCAACSKTVIGSYGGGQTARATPQKAPVKYVSAPALQASGQSAQAGNKAVANKAAQPSRQPASLPVLQASKQPSKQSGKQPGKQAAAQAAKAPAKTKSSGSLTASKSAAQPAAKSGSKQTAQQPRKQNTQTASRQTTRQISRGKATAVRGDAVCRTVRGQMGIRYKYGGTSPKTGFDCSGLLVWAYKQHGVSLPRTAKAQAGAGSSVQRNKLSPGDIVVFKIKSGYHTGLYTGNNKFIHSPRTGSTVREDQLDNSYWKKAYVGARRVI